MQEGLTGRTLGRVEPPEGGGGQGGRPRGLCGSEPEERGGERANGALRSAAAPGEELHRFVYSFMYFRYTLGADPIQLDADDDVAS